MLGELDPIAPAIVSAATAASGTPRPRMPSRLYDDALIGAASERKARTRTSQPAMRGHSSNGMTTGCVTRKADAMDIAAQSAVPADASKTQFLCGDVLRPIATRMNSALKPTKLSAC